MTKSWVVDFIITFLIVFVVSAAVSFAWAMIFDRSCTVDWGTAVRFGIILGIALTWIARRSGRGGKKE